MVHGGDHGQTELGDVQQSGAKALVVVHDVELVASLGEDAGDSQAERPRLGKARRPGGHQFEHVDAIADLAGTRDAERIGLAVEVEARHLGEPHSGVETAGVGLTGEDFDVVAEFFHDVPEEVTREAFSRPEPAQSDRPFADPWPLAAWPAVPTTGIAGRDDRLFPVEFQQRVARERLGLEIDVLPGGHLLAYSQPERLVEHLLDRG